MRRNSFYAYAQSDLQQMEINKEHGYIPYSNTCVAAQQYVEKMLKDKLQDFEDFPPKTHNIHVLMRHCQSQEYRLMMISTTRQRFCQVFISVPGTLMSAPLI